MKTIERSGTAIAAQRVVEGDRSERPYRGKTCGGRAVPGSVMVIVYNSQSYYVVEYPSQHGFEVVDKHARRGTFLTGDLAERFRCSIQGVIASSPSEEDVDEFLGELDALMTQRVAFH